MNRRSSDRPEVTGRHGHAPRLFFRPLALAAAVLLATWAGAQTVPSGGTAQPAALPGAQDGVSAPLDQLWLKLKVKATGFRVSHFTLETSPASFQTTAYMLLLAAEGGSPTAHYTYLMWTEVAPGEWVQTYSNDFVTDGANDELSVDSFIGFDMATYGVAAICNGRIVVKRNKQGDIVAATWKTLAGTVVDSSLPALPGPGDGTDVERFWGKLSIVGKRTTPDKLPFPII